MSLPNPVFDAFPRAAASYARHNEPVSSFLNRVGGEYWDSVREVINTWAEHYPDDARADLVGRLRSPDNRHFGGAFWELYLHESFLSSASDVQVHPNVSGPRPPDFLVTRGSEGYYVEATAMFGDSNVGEQARLRQVFDAINLVHSPDFFLSLDIRAIGQHAPPTKRLRSSLESWLVGLDPGTRSLSLLDHSGPELRWEEAGWDLVFRPFPVRADARGKGHLPLGMWGHHGARPVGNSESIRDTLKEKGSAYGALDRPLLIAINTSTGFNRDFETMNALYGSAHIRFNFEHPEYPPEDARGSDGYWGRPDSWAHRHVSGVLLAPNISAFDVATTSPTVWLHPSPASRIDLLNSWRIAELVGHQVEQKDSAISPRVMFGLPQAWPPGEPFPQR